MRNRIVPIAAVLVLCVLMLTGCSSSGEKEEASSSLYVTMINTYVPMEATETLQATLEQELPELISAGNGLIVNSVSSGDTEKDLRPAGQSELRQSYPAAGSQRQSHPQSPGRK